jgi:putative spermidine/putrescine transport system substrate-binding protein/spermidine/putrescine transport system substrate-binding protein
MIKHTGRFGHCGTLAIILAVGTLMAPLEVKAEDGQLSLLVWEGYADPSFVKDFEAESGCKVQATYVGSNDDFAPKLAAGGGVYDLLSVSSDAAEVLVRAGFVEPIDTSKVAEWKNIYDTFRNVSRSMSTAGLGGAVHVGRQPVPLPH